MNFKRGFTLIELLVVVAIIGILASVVLASLNSARQKGADAAIKANLSGMRAQAELIYDNRGCYNDDGAATGCTMTVDAAGDCATGSTTAGGLFRNSVISAAITAAGNSSNGGGLARGSCVQAASGGAWAISVPLKSVPADSWCVDSTGASRQVTPASDSGFSGNNCK